MKLNLLPTYVGKEKAARSAILLSIVFAAAGIGLSVFLISSSKDAVRQSQARIDDLTPQAQRVVARSKEADAIIQNASVLILNTELANAMNKHNAVYPDLYDRVRKYVPGFFRVTRMSAAPAGEDTAVTIDGVIQSQQQYADLMLALLRIPGAKSVTRQNYQIVETVVPPLSEGSQIGAPIKRGEAPLPDDALARLDRMINAPKTEGFQNTGGFGGTDVNTAKGAMPEWSLISVTVTFPGNIQTPDPAGTLANLTAAAGSGGAPATPAGGFTPPTPGPAGPAGPGGPAGGQDR